MDYIFITELDRILREYFKQRHPKFLGSPEIATRVALFGTSLLINKIKTLSGHQQKIYDWYDSKHYIKAIFTDNYVISIIYTCVIMPAIDNYTYFDAKHDLYFKNKTKFSQEKSLESINRFNAFQNGLSKFNITLKVPHGKQIVHYTFENIPMRIEIQAILSIIIDTEENLDRGKIEIKIEKKYLKDFKYPEYIQFLQRFLNYCANIYSGRDSSQSNGKINTYIISEKVWKESSTLTKRSIESIVGSNIPKIRNAIDQFLSEKRFYQEHDIPNKLVIFLHGPPGTGKTSLIKACVTEIKREQIYKLTFQENGVLLEDYLSLIRLIPENSVILIEDIDSDLVSNSKFIKTDFEGKTKMTHDAMLHIFENLPEGSILFITTNTNIETFDPAIMRPGRIDKIFYIGYAEKEDIIRFFTRFYFKSNEFSPELAKEFANRFEKIPEITIAQIQEHLLNHISDPVEALAQIKSKF